MNAVFYAIVAFMIVLALFDLFVGVSNDAVNFMNSAIGSKAARRRAILAVSAIGILIGTCLSNGMMDVARHGVFDPSYFSFYEVITIFLAVMVTDVVLLDFFNTLGLPTSTTVSLVFELIGGATALAAIKLLHGAVTPEGLPLHFADLINTQKAVTMIVGIFLSVAVAFTIGYLVQLVARLVFTFVYRVNGTTTSATGDMGNRTASSIKIGLFAGIACTSIVAFLLINGLKGTSLLTPDQSTAIREHLWIILSLVMLTTSAILTTLSYFRLAVLRFVVLFGTFALAMAFASNDLVNFIGVSLSSLESLIHFARSGSQDPDSFMMHSLSLPASTPTLLLIGAGVVMMASLVFSKKAANVVQTEVGLSSTQEGPQRFKANRSANAIVKLFSTLYRVVRSFMPRRMRTWIDSRYNATQSRLEEGAAYDLIRATTNLVAASSIVALGTSLKLPLSTTYVTFMVAMGASLADRAWSAESASARVAGVLGVVGGWLFTAGCAFALSLVLTAIMYFCKYGAMNFFIAMAIVLVVRSHRKKNAPRTNSDIKSAILNYFKF